MHGVIQIDDYVRTPNEDFDPCQGLSRHKQQMFGGPFKPSFGLNGPPRLLVKIDAIGDALH